MWPATAADELPVRHLVVARSRWLEERGLPSWRGSADVIAAQVADPAFPVWVLVEDDERVVGCTTLFEDVPTPGWAAAPQREPAFFLATAVTHPDYRRHRPGRLMAAWAVDRAAREGRAWVRLDACRTASCPAPRRRASGWSGRSPGAPSGCG